MTFASSLLDSFTAVLFRLRILLRILPPTQELGVAVPFKYSEGLKLYSPDITRHSHVSLAFGVLIEVQTCWQLLPWIPYT